MQHSELYFLEQADFVMAERLAAQAARAAKVFLPRKDPGIPLLSGFEIVMQFLRGDADAHYEAFEDYRRNGFVIIRRAYLSAAATPPQPAPQDGSPA